MGTTCIHGTPDGQACDRCEGLVIGLLCVIVLLSLGAIIVLSFLLGRATA